VPARGDHPPEHEDLPGRDEQDREDREEVRESRGVLERDGGVRVVEAAAVRPELLDRDLTGGGAARDRLLRAFERRRGRVSVEGLDDALRDQDHRQDDAERQQDVGHRSVEVAPEVPEPGRGTARDPADDGGQHGHPDARGDEVLHREPGHLAQVGHGELAAVVLPVRVRDEARGRVQRDVRRHAGHVVRIQEQVPLEPEQRVEECREDRAEDEHDLGVGLPVLLSAGAHEP
jgi:hypothetical protein